MVWNFVLPALITAAATVHNTEQQRSAFDKQMDENRIMREREDTAVQRRVSDQEAAGYSKYASMATGAQASPTRVGQSPQSDAVNAMSSMIPLLKQVSEMENIQAQTGLAKSQRGFNDAKTLTELTEGKIKGMDYKNYKKKLYAGLFKDVGIGFGGGGMAIKSIMQMLMPKMTTGINNQPFNNPSPIIRIPQ